MCVAFSPDGERIVTGTRDEAARLWASPSREGPITLQGHSESVRSVVFSLDGHRVVTGSDDHTAKVWDVSSAAELLTLKGHTAPVWCEAFSAGPPNWIVPIARRKKEQSSNGWCCFPYRSRAEMAVQPWNRSRFPVRGNFGPGPGSQ